MPSLSALKPFGDDLLAGLQPVFDDPERCRPADRPSRCGTRPCCRRRRPRRCTGSAVPARRAAARGARRLWCRASSARPSVLAGPQHVAADWETAAACRACRSTRSTARSTGPTVPVLRMHRAVGQRQLDAGPAVAFCARPRRIALDDAQVVGFGDGRRGRSIGSICEIVVSSVLSPRPTRLPGFTCVVPTSPLIGDDDPRVAQIERRLVRPRRSPLPPATRAASCAASASSSSCWLTACLATSGV